MSGAFRITELPGPIGLVTFDDPARKVNLFSAAVRVEMRTLLLQLKQQTQWQGVLLCSGKPGQFIAGADLRELASFAEGPPDVVARFLEEGHALLAGWSQLPYPTVVLVDGPALGGGTELALAFDFRIASDHSTTRFGLPETRLGMIPGWGGTQRLPRLMGVGRAAEMIATAEPVSAETALRWGLLAECAPVEELPRRGIATIQSARLSGSWELQRRRFQHPCPLDAIARDSAWSLLSATAAAKTGGERAALLAVLESMQRGLVCELEQGLLIEREIGARVIGSPAARELIEQFFAKKTSSSRSAPS